MSTADAPTANAPDSEACVPAAIPVAIAIDYVPLTEEQSRRALNVFQALDVNGNGTLDRDELLKVAQLCGVGESEQPITSLDLDQDGRVSQGEWELFLARLGARDKVHAALAFCEERTKTGAYSSSCSAANVPSDPAAVPVGRVCP